MGFEANSGMGAAALMYQKLKNEINSSLEKGKFDAVRVNTRKTNKTNRNFELKIKMFSVNTKGNIKCNEGGYGKETFLANLIFFNNLNMN